MDVAMLVLLVPLVVQLKGVEDPVEHWVCPFPNEEVPNKRERYRVIVGSKAEPLALPCNMMDFERLA